MLDRHARITSLIIALLGASMLASCAPRAATMPQPTSAQSASSVEPSPELQPTEPVPVATSTPAERPAVAAVAPTPSEPPVARTPLRAVEFAEHADLKDVYFGPGRFEIGREAGRVLEVAARWLKTNEDYLVLIEGHSDSQGTREANLALAARRAKAAMNYLVKQGVPQSRMLVVSYGADRPACPEKSEACMAKNRRVHFLVKGQ
jgi:outer membrane protein OmpA-like peptidoglycan-associated protein